MAENALVGLVAAIVRRAVADAGNLHLPERTRRQAAEFLNGSGLDIWCGLVGVDAGKVRAALERGGAGSGKPRV